MKVTEQIRQAGHGMSGLIGGQPKQKYWTPDGRVILSPPSMRGRMDGSVRDANLDKGWLLTPPTVLKLYCPNCALWHDTKVEVRKCGAAQKTLITKYTREAKKLMKASAEENEILKQEIAELKELVNKLLEREKNG